MGHFPVSTTPNSKFFSSLHDKAKKKGEVVVFSIIGDTLK